MAFLLFPIHLWIWISINECAGRSNVRIVNLSVPWCFSFNSRTSQCVLKRITWLYYWLHYCFLCSYFWSCYLRLDPWSSQCSFCSVSFSFELSCYSITPQGSLSLKPSACQISSQSLPSKRRLCSKCICCNFRLDSWSPKNNFSGHISFDSGFSDGTQRSS